MFGISLYHSTNPKTVIQVSVRDGVTCCWPFGWICGQVIFLRLVTCLLVQQIGEKLTNPSHYIGYIRLVCQKNCFNKGEKICYYWLQISANAPVQRGTHWTLFPPFHPPFPLVSARLTPLWFQGTAGPLQANMDNWSSLCPTRSNSATWPSVTFPRVSHQRGPSAAPQRSSPSLWVGLFNLDMHLVAAKSPWRFLIPVPSRYSGYDDFRQRRDQTWNLSLRPGRGLCADLQTAGKSPPLQSHVIHFFVF